METFKKKIAVWLEDQRIIFGEDNLAAEELCSTLHEIEHWGEDCNLESPVIKEITIQMLRLSFIIKNHPEELQKLITKLYPEQYVFKL